jgi:transposase-like protein
MERETADTPRPAGNAALIEPSTPPPLLAVPDNLADFNGMYGTDEACRRALMRARWPNGFVCPRCGHDRCYELAGRVEVECAGCSRHTSPLVGTLLESAKLPLSRLFLLLYLIVAEKDGANCKQLARQAGVNYNTARLWKLKVSDMLICRDKDGLTGRVEIDETITGASDETSRGRRLGAGQSYVLVMVEDRGKACGRLRLSALDDARGDTLKTVVREHLSDGAIARTDGLNAYEGLEDHESQPDRRLRHEADVVGDPKQASRKFPKVHLVASLLKRVILGTLQGSISKGWLPWLLAEFEYRFNRRNAKRRPLLWARMMEMGLKGAARTRAYFAKKGAMFRQLGLS